MIVITPYLTNPLKLKDVTVLHVDDDPALAELVGEYLEREDPRFSVLSTTGVDDGLSVLRTEGGVDCIVSDYDMPGTDGLDFLELIRDDHPELPFILLTGHGSERIASEAISAGVTEYLQKEAGTGQYTVLANRIRNSVRRVRAEAAFERTDARYHNLVDTAPIPIVLYCPEGHVIYSNEAAVSFLDADSHAEVEGKRFDEFLHPDDRKAARGRFERLMSENESMPEQEYRVQTTDGEIERVTVVTAHGYYRGQEVAQAMIYR